MQSVRPIMHSLNISLPGSEADRNFTGAHRAIVPWCVCPPPNCAPPEPDLAAILNCLYQPFLISHARISEWAAIFNKRKLLFCSACSGNNTHTHTHTDLGVHGEGFLKGMATDLDRRSAWPQCH